MTIFQGGPRLADTRVSTFWILSVLRVMEVVVAAGAVSRHAKLQSNHCHQHTNFLQAGCPYPTSPYNVR